MDRVDLTFDLYSTTSRSARRTPAPVTLGSRSALATTLDDATYAALEPMFALIQKFHGVERLDAIALASLTVDLRITQIVNGVVGVHAMLPHGAIR